MKPVWNAVFHRVELLAISVPLRLASWLALIAATGILVRGEMTRPERLEGVTVFTDLVYRELAGRRARLDVYVPEGRSPIAGRPAVIALHGGGWRGGSKTEYGRSLLPLVKHGLVVVAVDYRLSRPGKPSWPENLDDVRESVRWVRSNAAKYGIDARRIAVMGASAGGHLALLLATDNEPATRVSAVVNFYGPTDLRALDDAQSPASVAIGLCLGTDLGLDRTRLDDASPLRKIRVGMPPVLILHGTEDLLIPLDQSRSLADALTDKQVPHKLVVLEGERHGFELHAGKANLDLTPEIISFLDSAWLLQD